MPAPRVTEATNINVGLLALKRCVDALHEAQRRRREGIEPPPHVPYSDSKLTELLSDALGGDGKTAVLVACAPEHEHAVETAQSLRFGERCASVETRARVGRDALAGALALLNEKIEDCESRIKRSERWVTTTTTRRDEIDGTDERPVMRPSSARRALPIASNSRSTVFGSTPASLSSFTAFWQAGEVGHWHSRHGGQPSALTRILTCSSCCSTQCERTTLGAVPVVPCGHRWRA